MTRRAIHTNQAPQAIGPYSQAVDTGNMVFVSGQIPINPGTGEIVEGIEGQTGQVMKNLQAILLEAGLTFANVVKFTIFLADMEYFSKVNEVYSGYLTEPYPARGTVEVSRLPKDVRIEIEAIAVR